VLSGVGMAYRHAWCMWWVTRKSSSTRLRKGRNRVVRIRWKREERRVKTELKPFVVASEKALFRWAELVSLGTKIIIIFMR